MGGDNQPSAEFINRLEKALLPHGDAEGTLNMDDPDSDNHTFEDGNFKNKLVDIKGLFAKSGRASESQPESSGGLSRADETSYKSSSHKSEPMMGDSKEEQDDALTELLKQR